MSQIKTITVSWFSAGVSSAVATWLMRDKIDHIIYCHIDDQHEDTMRFVKDCEQWFGKPIEILQSPLKSVEAACRQSAFVRAPHGAPCTRLLKRRVRAEWESAHEWFCKFAYVWGMDADEADRADGLRADMPEQTHHFPLIDAGIRKEEAHGILLNAGIKRPAMYDIGYRNNNCIGCVKGGMWYWNKIRRDFPEVFAARAKLEREIGGTCIKGQYLDELKEGRGREEDEVMPECGAACQSLQST
jgi:hypothetical protein